MATYTKIPLFDLKKIALSYGIKALDFKAMEGGNTNSNYYIRGEQSDYMLTLAEEKSWEETQQLATLLQWLEKYGFVTSKVHLSLDAETVTVYAGKPVLIKKWIEGKVCENMSGDMLGQIGESMAKLHQIPAPEFLPKLHPYGLQMFSTVVDKAIDKAYESWLAKQIQILNQNLPDNLPSGLIHGDVFFDNVLFKDNKIKAIIDFEEACCYPLLFDLGMAILGLCRTNEEIDLMKIKALIKGYEELRPLENLEKEFLPLFIKYAATATSYWRFWKYNIHSPSPEGSGKHWEMVDIAKQIENLVLEDFRQIVFD